MEMCGRGRRQEESRLPLSAADLQTSCFGLEDSEGSSLQHHQIMSIMFLIIQSVSHSPDKAKDLSIISVFSISREVFQSDPFTVKYFCSTLIFLMSINRKLVSWMQLSAALHSPSQSSPIGFCTVSTSLPQGYLWVSTLSPAPSKASSWSPAS